MTAAAAISGEADVTSSTRRSRATCRCTRRGRHVGARRPLRRQLDDQQQLRRGQGRRRLQRAPSRSSSPPSATTSPRSPPTSARASGSRRSARSSARPRSTTTAASVQPTGKNCHAPPRRSCGFNVVTDNRAACRAGRRRRRWVGAGPLRENGGMHETQMPGNSQPGPRTGPGRTLPRLPPPALARGRAPPRRADPRPPALMRTDQRGVPRARRDAGCDAGAVEVTP